MLRCIGAWYLNVVRGISHPLCTALTMHKQQMYALPRECVDYFHELLQRNPHGPPPSMVWNVVLNIQQPLHSICCTRQHLQSSIEIWLVSNPQLCNELWQPPIYLGSRSPALSTIWNLMLCTAIQECQIHVCVPSNATDIDIEPRLPLDFSRSPWRPGLPCDDVYKDVVPLCFNMCMTSLEIWRQPVYKWYGHSWSQCLVTIVSEVWKCRVPLYVGWFLNFGSPREGFFFCFPLSNFQNKKGGDLDGLVYF